MYSFPLAAHCTAERLALQCSLAEVPKMKNNNTIVYQAGHAWISGRNQMSVHSENISANMRKSLPML